MNMSIIVGLSNGGGSEGESAPPVIMAIQLPSLGALNEIETPADGLIAGSYFSTAGTITSAVVTYYANDVVVSDTYDLDVDDIVRASILVTDSATNTRIFSTGPVTVSAVSSDLTETFGALTLVGSGGVAVTGTDISTGDALGHWQIGSGVITPSPAGVIAGLSGAPYSLVLNDGQTVDLSATADDFSTRADTAEIEAAAVAAGLSNTRTITVRDGVATGSRLDLNNLAFTGKLTIRALAFWQVTLPGLTAAGSSKIRFENVNFYRAYETGVDTPNSCICEIQNTDGIEFSGCQVGSATFDTFVWGLSPDVLVGIGYGNAGNLDNVIIENCYIHDTETPYLLRGTGATIDGNYFLNAAAKFGSHIGDTSGLTLTNNVGIGIWANGSDAGNPHSTLLGWGNNVDTADVLIEGNIYLVGSNRFDSQGDYHGFARLPGIDDPTSLCTNYIIRNNIFVGNGNIMVIEGLVNSTVENNTLCIDQNAIDSATPQTNIKIERAGAGVIIRDNLGGGITWDAGDEALFHADLWNNADNNIWIDWSDGNVARDAYLTGPFASALTIANVQAQLAPKAGSLPILGPYNAGAVNTGYWTFATGQGTQSYVGGNGTTPAKTKPITTLATGTSLAKVEFDGINDWATDNGSPFSDFSGNAFTLQFGLEFRAGTDGTDMEIISGTSTKLRVRRYASGLLHISMRNSAGEDLINRYFPQVHEVADGYVVYTISCNFSTGQFHFMRGSRLEGVLGVFAPGSFVPGTWDSNMAVLRIGAAYTNGLTRTAGMQLSHVYISDEFADMHVAANQTKLIGLDGEPAPLGANGSTPTGIRPQIYLQGNEAAWNAGGGLNLGSTAVNWLMAGAVTDVGGGSYTQSLFDTQGSAYVAQNTTNKTQVRYLEFSGWITPLSVSGTQMLFSHRDGTQINFAGDQLQVIIEDSGEATRYSDISDIGLFSTGILYHIYVGVDLGGVSPTINIRVNGVAPAGMSTSIAAGTGLVNANRNWGLFATRTGVSKIDCLFGDYWIGQSAPQGSAAFYNGGVPPDLTSVGTPVVWLGGDQNLANINAYANKGSFTLSAGSATFVDS